MLRVEFLAESGYSPKRFEGQRLFRKMTVEEAKKLSPGDIVYFLDRDKKVREMKVNGKVKTWKTDEGRVKVPVKYGMYEYSYIEDDGDGYVTHAIVQIERLDQ